MNKPDNIFHSFQEAKYHASENGFLDIALELRNLGEILNWVS